MSGLLKESRSRLRDCGIAGPSCRPRSRRAGRSSLPAVKRLLSLQPHHVEVVQLARQFARQLLPMAQKCAQLDQYP